VSPAVTSTLHQARQLLASLGFKSELRLAGRGRFSSMMVVGRALMSFRHQRSPSTTDFASLLEGRLITQNELEAVAGITAVSIRHSLKALVQALSMQELSRYVTVKKKLPALVLLHGRRSSPPPSWAADHNGKPAGASGSSPSGILSAPHAPDLFSRY